MKIFLDTANVESIREYAEMGIVDGVTTNPTLIARENKEFEPLIREISSIVKGPISAEVLSLDVEGMLREAKKLASINDNIVVKLPMTKESVKATRTLSKEGIKVNMTLIFSPAQALLAAKAGARFLSPFIGRLDDISSNGIELVYSIREILDNYDFDCEIIAASIRHPMHVLEAAKAGADISTMPPSVLEQMFKHPLTDIGIQRFLNDWEKTFGEP